MYMCVNCGVWYTGSITTHRCFILQCSGEILVHSRIGLGLLGVILVGISVVAALGLLSYMRVKATLIIIEVVPFLVLAVGTDNLFILTHAYEVSCVDKSLSTSICNLFLSVESIK